MSNRLHITRFKMENLDNGNVSFGVRVSDDYSDYVNDYIAGEKGEALTELPSTKEGMILLLVELAESNQTLCDLLDFHSNQGAYLIDDWIDGEEFQQLLNSAKNICDEKGEE